MLVPAAVLVLFVLGSIAVDHSIAFLAQRELTGAAAAAANDAATAALSDNAFYQGRGDRRPGSVEIDGAEATRLVDRALAARVPSAVRDVVARVEAAGTQVCVTLTGRVELIFAKALPGAPRGITVKGHTVATAVEGPAGTEVPARSIC